MAITTKDTQQQDETNFADAFNEEPASVPAQSEDEAFGISPESGEEDQGSPATVTVEVSPAETQAVEGEAQTAEEAAETPAVEAGEGDAGETAENTAEESGEPVQEDWEQKYKTLQGKYNAEVSNRAPVETERNETGNVRGNADGTPEEVNSADEAMSKLSDDFGPDFVQMITAIASAIASAAAQEVASKTIEVVDRDVKDIIAHLQDRGQQDHFEKVAGAHPDFMDIANSPAFAQWLGTRPAEEQANDQRILASGNAKEIIGILGQFKASAPADDGSADAAEGVRSGRAQLPVSPEAGPSDYADAWNQA